MLADRLNEAKVKPVIVNGKIGFYSPDSGSPSEPSSGLAEQFGVTDAYIGQNPHSDEFNNFVVWASGDDETIYFNKSARQWATE